jgi:hypothetical protein
MLKRKVMLGATAGLLGALSIAGAAFAQEGPVDGSNPRDSIKDRVAEILGVERDALDDAMRTAREENRESKHDERLAALVEAGTITQEQADEWDAWNDEKPDVMNKLKRLGKRGTLEQKLTYLVENEIITQAEADEVQAWVDAKPDWLDDLKDEIRPDRRGRGHSHPHRHDRGRGHHFPRGIGQFEQAPSDQGTDFVLPNGDQINI